MAKIKMYKIVEKKYLWFLISSITIFTGMFLGMSRLLMQQPSLNFGIDFTGGTSMLLQFEELPKMNNAGITKSIRDILNMFKLEKSRIQLTQDKEILITTQKLTNQERNKILAEIENKMGSLILLESDTIGPSIGAELRQKSLWIIFLVSMALLLFITWRFEFSFGVAALVALVHDALVTLSFSAILMIEINTAYVAAILTILGYSINDTIVLFDRVRENFKHSKANVPANQIINLSIKQVFRRTLFTSLTTMLVVSSLIIFGGTTIKGFALVLLIGIISGTYSSIFIACPILNLFHPHKHKK